MQASSDRSENERHRLYDAVFFVALVATGFAFGAALAHALELPNKLSLSRETYFVVQDIYRGWWQLAFVLLIEIAAMLAILVMSRRQRTVFLFTLVALGCVVAAQVVFWVWTYPANAATQNWTSIPENWEVLRRQWEFSHLAGAGFQFLAFCALVLATLASRRVRDC
jgi:hypothetical protein